MIKLKEAIGDDYYRIIEISRFLLTENIGTKYFFVPIDEIEKKVEEYNRIYWLEMFYRSHMSAYSGLKRMLMWIDALEKSENNYIAFCSSLRGLMECTGDTFQGLNRIAISLAMNKPGIKKCLEGKADTLTVSKELEDLLIHFIHASKAYYEASKDKNHIPKSAKETILELEKGSKIKFYDYYKVLCDITHPAYLSLGYNFEAIEEGRFVFSLDRDAKLIDASLKRDKELLRELLMRGFNPITILIKTINLFELTEMYSKKADEINLKVPAWENVLKAFQK